MALISGPTVDRAISDPDNELTRLAQSDVSDQELVESLFMRILNRPATTQEVQACLSSLTSLPAEHRQLAKQLQQEEQRWAPRLAREEAQRQAAIRAAEQELQRYERKIAEREHRLDTEHAERLAAAEEALAAHTARLPQLLDEWERTVQQPTTWHALEPIELLATNGAELKTQDDLSVLASGSNGKTTYKFVARSDLAGITGVKLELFADPSLPGKGPGRAQNGNFVLSEFRLERADESQPDQRAPIALQNAQADYSQANYDITSAIDGKAPATNNGWATSPETGKNRTAVFETRESPQAAPSLLTFWLDQQYQDGKHTIGKFRISVTASPRPITLKGLPKNIAEILATAADQRSEPQGRELLDYYRGLDPELKRLEQTLAKARQPRPVDPQLKQLRDRLAEASKPVPIDPGLARLRHDVDLSTQQLKDARLTFAQDLAWALINNPAFLFNH
jgi:hypothetical protein